MIKTVKEFLKEKTENISFIQLRKDTQVNLKGYTIPTTMPLPIVIDELVKGIKEKTVEEEIKITSIIKGMIYLLGVDPEFKYANEYTKILYQYDEGIEDYILYQGLKYMEEGQTDESLIYLSALISLNPKHILGLYNYAFALEEKANKAYRVKDSKLGSLFLNESTNFLEDITDIDPQFTLAYYKLGFHYLAQKQFKKTQIIWEKFIDLDDNEDRVEEIEQNLMKIQDDITYEEGYYEILRGNPEGGIEKLIPLKERFSDWWNLLFMIGLGYRQLGRYNEAKQEFENVLAIKPEQIDTLNELGLCLAYLGHYQEAIDKFTKAIDQRPKDYEILCNRGMTYLQMDKLEEAEKDIQMAYSINPEDDITKQCKLEIDRRRNMD